MQTAHYKTVEYKNKPFRVAYTYHPGQAGTESSPEQVAEIEIAEIMLNGFDVSDVLDYKTFDALYDRTLILHNQFEREQQLEAALDSDYYG